MRRMYKKGQNDKQISLANYSNPRHDTCLNQINGVRMERSRWTEEILRTESTILCLIECWGWGTDFYLRKLIYTGVIHWDRDYRERSKWKMSSVFVYVKFEGLLGHLSENIRHLILLKRLKLSFSPFGWLV